MLIEYIRDKKNQKKGIVVAGLWFFGQTVKNPERQVKIGWSLCNEKDRFDKERAMTIAVGRAINGKSAEDCDHLPHTARNPVERMRERALRYFKTENIKIV